MNDDFEVTRGKGNVFRDFGYADADAQHLRAVLAAQIIKVLDVRKMTVRKAEDATGIAAADFSRIRTAKLDRFTIDLKPAFEACVGKGRDELGARHRRFVEPVRRQVLAGLGVAAIGQLP